MAAASRKPRFKYDYGIFFAEEDEEEVIWFRHFLLAVWQKLCPELPAPKFCMDGRMCDTDIDTVPEFIDSVTKQCAVLFLYLSENFYKERKATSSAVLAAVDRLYSNSGRSRLVVVCPMTNVQKSKDDLDAKLGFLRGIAKKDFHTIISAFYKMTKKDAEMMKIVSDITLEELKSVDSFIHKWLKRVRDMAVVEMIPLQSCEVEDLSYSDHRDVQQASNSTLVTSAHQLEMSRSDNRPLVRQRQVSPATSQDTPPAEAILEIPHTVTTGYNRHTIMRPKLPVFIDLCTLCQVSHVFKNSAPGWFKSICEFLMIICLFPLTLDEFAAFCKELCACTKTQRLATTPETRQVSSVAQTVPSPIVTQKSPQPISAHAPSCVTSVQNSASLGDTPMTRLPDVPLTSPPPSITGPSPPLSDVQISPQPSLTGTTSLPSDAGTWLPPSDVQISLPPSLTGTTPPPSEAGTSPPQSLNGTVLPPSEVQITLSQHPAVVHAHTVLSQPSGTSTVAEPIAHHSTASCMNTAPSEYTSAETVPKCIPRSATGTHTVTQTNIISMQPSSTPAVPDPIPHPPFTTNMQTSPAQSTSTSTVPQQYQIPVTVRDPWVAAHSLLPESDFSEYSMTDSTDPSTLPEEHEQPDDTDSDIAIPPTGLVLLEEGGVSCISSKHSVSVEDT